jgi:hypothetical protein
MWGEIRERREDAGMNTGRIQKRVTPVGEIP